MAAMSMGYLSIHYRYVERQFGLFRLVDLLTNAQSSSVTVGNQMSGKVFSSYSVALLTLFVAALAVVGSLGLVRRGRVDNAAVLVVLGGAPLVLRLSQDYGGALMRFSFFALPWCSGLAAEFLFYGQIVAVRHRFARRMVATCAPILVGALFLPSFYGQAQLHVVSAAEVDAANWLYRTAERGDVLLLTAPGFPERGRGNYNTFSGPRSDAIPNLLENPEPWTHIIGAPEAVDRVSSIIREYSDDGYLVFSTGQEASYRTLLLGPPNALDELEAAIARSDRFQRVLVNDDVRIYRMSNG